MRNQGLFIRQSHQSINEVNGNIMKMCASTMESRKGGNNVHFVSKHVSRNEFSVHIGSLGFWVRLEFAKHYEAIAFL